MPLNVRPPGGGSARTGTLRQAVIGDFRGGLNLSDDLFKLGENESPDMLNMDVDARGGLSLRGGMVARSEQLDIENYSGSGVGRFLTADGETAEVVFAMGRDLSSFGAVGLSAQSVDGLVNVVVGPAVDLVNPQGDTDVAFVQFNDVVYQISQRFNLATFVLDVPSGVVARTISAFGGLPWGTGGFVPRGTTGAVFDNRLWVGNTEEDGDRFRNRIRFSEDSEARFEEDNFIDIDVGEDGDRITALVVHGEILIVFKQRSMYAVIPVDDEFLYQVVPISSSVGVRSNEAATSTPFGLMFWDGRAGLHVWSENEPTPVSDRIVQAIHERRIPYDGDVAVSWVKDRIWCSVEFDSRREVFLFDPELGAWMRYAPGVERGFQVGDTFWAYSRNLRRWLEIDIRSSLDDLNFDTLPESIPSYWVSPWIDGGNHVLPKRFRRPRFVLAASFNGGVLDVEVRGDLDPRNNVRRFDVMLPQRVGDTAWGVLEWNEDDWGAFGEEYADCLQGPAVGNFKSVQFRINGPTTVARWRLDALSVGYLNRTLRS